MIERAQSIDITGVCTYPNLYIGESGVFSSSKAHLSQCFLRFEDIFKETQAGRARRFGKRKDRGGGAGKHGKGTESGATDPGSAVYKA